MGSLTAAMTLPKGVPALSPGGCFGMFLPMQPPSVPGNNTLTITGLPVANIKAISVWVTEILSNGLPHAGGAIFETRSVQLDAPTNTCRVIFTQNWTTPLAAAAMVIVCT